jgi:cytoskeleton protein RodZ
MSDAKDKADEDTAPSEPQGPLGGERLAEARRKQKISVAGVAKELHLDEQKVRALERNEFDLLGAPVFAKGHLRKYAQLVGVDEGDVMSDYYQLNRASGMPPLVSSRARPRREMAPGPWIAVIVVLIVVATAYWWFTTMPDAVEEPTTETVTQQPATEPGPEPAAAAEPELIVDDDSSVLESAEAESEADEQTAEPAEPAEPAEDPALDDGQIRMLLRYTGDCWTEISDAGGRRLFFGLGKDGRTVELSGQAPFNVLFGNADNVVMQVNGVERAIAASERRGRTARLTIAGS